ncbi:MAG: 5-formyltetrahydrofolate cyclo-ligase [Gammaproteobacteria bacterium]|nr:5-formyltetrahydrofolate cyclo-ligase [Gammaproteobacteria bacterium]
MSYHQEIRKKIFKERDQLSQTLQSKFAQKAADHLIHSNLFKKAQHIACYIKVGAEIDPYPIIEKIWIQNKKCYLPVIDPVQYGKMYFAPYQQGDRLVKSRFRIPEPIFDTTQFIDPQKLDLVILPLSAFDRKGNRIGTGGGYYDRAFYFIKKGAIKKRPILCGLAYSFQEIEDVKPSEWDVPIDAIVTELGLTQFEKILPLPIS